MESELFLSVLVNGVLALAAIISGLLTQHMANSARMLEITMPEKVKAYDGLLQAVHQLYTESICDTPPRSPADSSVNQVLLNCYHVEPFLSTDVARIALRSKTLGLIEFCSAAKTRYTPEERGRIFAVRRTELVDYLFGELFKPRVHTRPHRGGPQQPSPDETNERGQGSSRT